ncbi:MAG: hypothetical protein DCF32_10680 [Leptolyngbya sp.]|nr:MAG: hypothetical protein DCF32_10680 [Leptolyngbya sp.]
MPKPKPKKRSRRGGSLKVKLPTLKQCQKMLMGSDRPGHLFAAVVAGATVATIGALILSPWLATIGAIVPIWEWAATPDVDVADQRSRSKGSILWRAICCLWFPYGKLVGHRSRLSHSLAFGLPCRVCYVFLVAAIAAQLGISAPWSFLMGGAGQLWADGYPMLAVAAVLSQWATLLLAGAIADTVHMLKDNYTPEEVVWGK